MPEFDPDKFLADEPQEFDPNAFLADTTPPQQQPSTWEHVKEGLRAAGNPMLLGAQAPIMGALLKAGLTVNDLVTGSDSSGLTYEMLRDNIAKDSEEQSKKFPVASTVGTVAGNIATGLAGGAAMKGAGLVGQGLTRASRFGDAAKMGAVLGGLQHPGVEEGKEASLQLKERLQNALGGAAVGMLTQGVLETPAMLGGKLRAFADRRAAKALGATKADLKKMGVDKVQQLGRRAYDEGIMSPFSTADDMAPAIQKRLDQANLDLDSLIAGVDDNTSATFSTKNAAKTLQDRLMSRLEDAVGGSSEAQKVQGYLDSFGSKGDLSISRLRQVKQATDKLFREKDWHSEGTPAKEALKGIRRSMGEGMEELAEQVAPGLGGEVKDANLRVHDLIKMEQLNKNELAKNIGNRFFSPTDYGVGGLGAVAGFASGDSLEDRVKKAAIGGSLGLGHKLMRERGSAVMGSVADKVARMLQGESATLGKFAQPLKQAMQKSPQAFQATVYMLSKNPEFKRVAENPVEGPALSIKERQEKFLESQ